MNFKKTIQIGNNKIGSGNPVYIVAEISANHHQKFEDAVALILKAKQAGANAVKLQTYTADTLTLKSDNPCFKIGKGTIWEGKTLYDLYNKALTPWEWHEPLKQEANRLGLDLFSSPFDATAVDFLKKLDMPAYKIASFELVDIPLIRYVAKQGKPVILSTGMASLDEITQALQAVYAEGNEEVVLLKCTSAYPASPSEMNLKTIPDMIQKLQVPVGLSDHTLDDVSAITSVAFGAVMIEKHITLSRQNQGPDSEFSLEPQEFKKMVEAIRTAEKSLGNVNYEVTPLQKPSLAFRRSLFVVQEIKKGEKINSENVRSIRPSQGLAPKYYDEVMGQKVLEDIPAGTPLEWKYIKK